MEVGGDVRKFYLHVEIIPPFLSSPKKAEEHRKRDHVFLLVSDESDDEGGEDSVGNMPTFLAHNPGMDFYFPYRTTPVCIGSFIYLLGGYYLAQDMPKSYGLTNLKSRDIWYIDTSSPSNGWTKGPPMTFRRSCPCAVAVDRKIYVIGGERSDNYRSEVFDTQTQTWSDLVFPSFIANKDLIEGVLVNLDVDVVVNDHKMRKFLLLYGFDHGSLYFYDLEQFYCGVFDRNFGQWANYSQKLVISGSTLFAVKYNKLHAYNVVSREWFKHPVKGLDFPETTDYYFLKPTPLLYGVSVGGGRLCLVLFPVENMEGRFIPTCTWFTVCEDNNSDLVAKIYHTTKFLLHSSLLMNVFSSPSGPPDSNLKQKLNTQTGPLVSQS